MSGRERFLEIKGGCTDAEEKKLRYWEKSLVDTSLRSPLISLKQGKNLLVVGAQAFGDVERALCGGRVFRLSFSDPAQEQIASELCQKAQESRRESGAGTLFLVRGLLRWFDPREEKEAKYAPIFLREASLERRETGRGYNLEILSDEDLINPALTMMLSERFGIRLTDLQTPPEYLALLQRACAEREHWSVLPEAAVGLFSFTGFALYRDLRGHQDVLEESPVVRSLMQGHWEEPAEEEHPEPSLTSMTLSPLDSSQRSAVRAALMGESFVLHGAPGTGKSQTITAMIAASLSEGKTVLMVAEKEAALSVVRQRLERMGLGSRVLCIDSPRMTKKEILGQVGAAMEVRRLQDNSERLQARQQEYLSLREELAGYQRELFTRRACGFTLQELLDLYLSMEESAAEILPDGACVASLGQEQLEEDLDLVGELTDAGRVLGHPCDHPLSAIHRTSFEQSLLGEVDAALQSAQDDLNRLHRAMASFVQSAHLPVPSTQSAWETLLACAGICVGSADLPAVFLDDRQSAQAGRVVRYLEIRRRVAGRRNTLRSRWQDAFLELDSQTLIERYDEAQGRRFGRSRAISLIARELEQYSRTGAVGADEVSGALQELSCYQQERSALRTQRQALSAPWQDVLRSCGSEQEVRELMGRAVALRRMILEYGPEVCGDRARETAAELLQCRDRAEESVGRLTALLDVRFSEERPGSWLSQNLQLCSALRKERGQLRAKIRYNRIAQRCGQAGLQPVVRAYEEGMDHDQVALAFRRGLCHALIQSCFESSPVLSRFNGASYDEAVREYGRLSEQLAKLGQKSLARRLDLQVRALDQDAHSGRQLGLLRRAVSCSGRKMTIRDLFAQTREVLQTLCPCFLMSPQAAARFLEERSGMFDLVIFDEASQIPASKAVGALARGKSAVIVGDPNQMPPTSFFESRRDLGVDGSEEDLESVLDDALAVGVPSRYLRWHYRSADESLITFANREFYDGRMYSFPSPRIKPDRIHLVQVKGTYDSGKTRTNPKEAQALADAIYRHYQGGASRKRSLGVITFNVAQQSLIRELVETQMQKDPGFARWAQESEEPLFIRNLETVQGDERDEIFFSIGFGPCENGKISMNFGPVGQTGGWRRLNVALTRARCAMTVFTSLTADQMKVGRGAARGTRALQDFLRYAADGDLRHLPQCEESACGREPGSARELTHRGIAAGIRRTLEDAGYEVEENLGCSANRIDLAVRVPGSRRYLCGILLDRAGCDLYDREISSQQMLKRQGWQLSTVRYADWYMDREGCAYALLHFLGSLRGEGAAPGRDLLTALAGTGQERAAGKPAAQRKEKKESALHLVWNAEAAMIS